MNIFLLPYTWPRHLAMAWWCAGAGLLAWWSVLGLVVVGGLYWPPEWDGPVLLGAITTAVTTASLAGEANLRRHPVLKRLAIMGIGAGLTLVLTLLSFAFWQLLVPPIVFQGDHLTDATDASLVSLSYRITVFGSAGLSGGIGALIARKLSSPISHLAGGVAAGLSAAVVWHILNATKAGDDLYLAGAAMGLTWGGVYGLITWGIPEDLYTGWLRVLSYHRFGRRIPVDALDGSEKERFVGHFPRGLDLWLPVENGVMELHLSLAVDKDHRYAARGLSLQPTTVLRFLERIDLRYDPRRPAPLETAVSHGDRIVLGSGAQSATVEFIMLPKEER